MSLTAFIYHKLRSIFKEEAPRYSTRFIARWLVHEFSGHWLQASFNTIIGILIVLLDLTFVWCCKLVIDIATGETTRFSFTQAACMLISTVLCNIILSYIGRWIRAILGVRAQNKMQRRTYMHLLSAKWSGLEQFHSGDVLNRIEKDVTQIISFLTESIPNFITAVVQFTGAFLFLFIMDRTLAVAIVVILPFFLCLSRFYVSKMRTFSRAIRTTDSSIQATIQESLQHNIVIKALARLSLFEQRLSSLQQLLQSQIKQRTKFSSTSAAIMQVGFSAGYLFAFLWGAGRLQNNLITYGTLIAFVQLVGQIQAPLRNLTGYIPLLITTLTSAERVLDLHLVESENNNTQNCTTNNNSTPPTIEIRNLNYQYDNHRQIIHNLNFDFPAGSATAIVGETGAGKTTLIRLLLGLIQPNNGTITLTPANATTTPLLVSPSTRPLFCYVPQGNTLFSGTIYNNLLLGNPNATENQMNQALKVACADFVFSLPNGIHTICGEQGYGLSEGQAQRICIARALLQQGPILLLDEATSALDAQTEQQVLLGIRQHCTNKTLIIVSHHQTVINLCPTALYLQRIKA